MIFVRSLVLHFYLCHSFVITQTNTTDDTVFFLLLLRRICVPPLLYTSTTLYVSWSTSDCFIRAIWKRQGRNQTVPYCSETCQIQQFCACDLLVSKLKSQKIYQVQARTETYDAKTVHIIYGYCREAIMLFF